MSRESRRAAWGVPSFIEAGNCRRSDLVAELGEELAAVLAELREIRLAHLVPPHSDPIRPRRLRRERVGVDARLRAQAPLLLLGLEGPRDLPKAIGGALVVGEHRR